MPKFSTVNGSLLTNNGATLPTMIEYDKLKMTKPCSVSIEANQDFVNSKSGKVERLVGDGATRDIASRVSAHDVRALATRQLASFMNGRRYTLISSRLTDDQLTFVVSVDGVPATYEMSYVSDGRRVTSDRTFTASLDGKQIVYPFTTAGFEDSLADLTTTDLDHGVTVPSAYGRSVMTRMEIVRRCGNRLRIADEAIREQQRLGNIVAVGSNEYASVYDMKMLFPDLNQPYEPGEAHTADRVEATLADGVNERRSIDTLRDEAVAVINHAVNVVDVDSVSREGSSLFVSATVNVNHARERMSFLIQLNGEHVDKVACVETDDGERLSMAQLMHRIGRRDRVAEFLHNRDNKIAGGYVYVTRSLQRHLRGLVRHESLERLVDDWCDAGLVHRLNTTTVASEYTLNELLRLTNAELLDDDEVAQMRQAYAFFGEGCRPTRVDVADGDTRDDQLRRALADEMNAVTTYVNAHLRAVDVKRVSKGRYVVMFNADGRRQLPLTVAFDDAGDVVDATAMVAGSEVPVGELMTRFASSELLRQLVKLGDVDVAGKVLFTRRSFHDRLHDLLEPDQIDAMVDEMVADGRLEAIGEDRYASRLGFYELMRTATQVPVDGLRERNLALANRLTDVVDRVDVADGDVRRVSAKAGLDHAHGVMTRLLPTGIRLIDFSLRDVTTEGMTVDVRCLNASFGVGRRFVASFSTTGELRSLTTPEGVKVDDLGKALEPSVMIRKLSKLRGRATASLGSVRRLKAYLGNVLAEDDVDELVDGWRRNGVVQFIDADQFTSRVGLDELLDALELTPYTDDEVSAHLAAMSRLTGVVDRVDVADGDVRDASATVDRRLAAVRALIADVFADAMVSSIAGDRFLLDFTDDGPRGLMLIVAFDDDRPIDVTCTVGEDELSLDELAAMIAESDLLKAYLTGDGVRRATAWRARRTTGAMLCRRGFHDRLHDLMDDEAVDELVDRLVTEGRLTSIGNDVYASRETFVQLIADAPEVPDVNVGAERRRLANRLGERRFTRTAVTDGDTRRVTRTVTKDEMILKFQAWLPDDVKLVGVDDVELTDGRATFAARLFNDAVGVESAFDVTCALNDEGELVVERTTQGGADVTITDGFQRSELAAAHDEMFGRTKGGRGRKLINVHCLGDQLARVAGNVDVKAIVDGWLCVGAVSVVDDDHVVTDRTLDELLSLVNVAPLSAEERRRNVTRAAAVRQAIPRRCVVADGDIRLPEDGRTTDLLEETRASLMTRLDAAVADELITASRVDGLRERIVSASTEGELGQLAMDLERYTGRVGS